MDEEILKSVKAFLGPMIDEDDSFDAQILEIINMQINPLTQVGAIVPLQEPISADTVWSEIIATPPNKAILSDNYNVGYDIKRYINCAVKMLFEPPVSTVTTIMEDIKRECLFRIEVAYHE